MEYSIVRRVPQCTDVVQFCLAALQDSIPRDSVTWRRGVLVLPKIVDDMIKSMQVRKTLVCFQECIARAIDSGIGMMLLSLHIEWKTL